MKKIGLWGFAGVAVVIIIAIISAFQFGEKSPILVAGKITVNPALMEQAKAAPVLFITLFDAQSQAPMPYGAMRETLTAPIGAGGYEFVITPERISSMAQGRPQPTAFRVKARLDMDGQGGMDQSGDLTGKVDSVPVGTDNVQIVITEVVP